MAPPSEACSLVEVSRTKGASRQTGDLAWIPAAALFCLASPVRLTASIYLAWPLGRHAYCSAPHYPSGVSRMGGRSKRSLWPPRGVHFGARHALEQKLRNERPSAAQRVHLASWMAAVLLPGSHDPAEWPRLPWRPLPSLSPVPIHPFPSASIWRRERERERERD